MTIDTRQEQAGLGAVVEIEQSGEPLPDVLDEFLQARTKLEDAIRQTVLVIDNDTPPDNLEVIRQQVIDAYKALSGHNYYPDHVIARPSRQSADEVL
jgi:hypothetical protein